MELPADKVRAMKMLKAQVGRLMRAAQQALPPAAGREQQKAQETAASGQQVLKGSARQQGPAVLCLPWIRVSWSSLLVWGWPPLPGGPSSKRLLLATALVLKGALPYNVGHQTQVFPTLKHQMLLKELLALSRIMTQSISSGKPVGTRSL